MNKKVINIFSVDVRKYRNRKPSETKKEDLWLLLFKVRIICTKHTEISRMLSVDFVAFKIIAVFYKKGYHLYIKLPGYSYKKAIKMIKH